MSTTDDEIDKILANLFELDPIITKGQPAVEKAKQAIKAYTDKARIEQTRSNWGSMTMLLVSMDAIDAIDEMFEKILAQLKGDK